MIGVIETGLLDGVLLRQALTSLPKGTWELVCHPGYDDADLRAVHTRLLEARERERDLLTSPELQGLSGRAEDPRHQLPGFGATEVLTRSTKSGAPVVYREALLCNIGDVTGGLSSA